MELRTSQEDPRSELNLSESEDSYEFLAQLAAQSCGASAAAITLGGPDGPTLKAVVGLPSGELPDKQAVGLYAEEPLTTGEGEVLGALCVINHRQLSLGDLEREILVGLARQATALIERERTEEERALALKRKDDVERLAHVASWEWDLESDVAVWSPEMHRFLGLEPGVIGNREIFMGLIHQEDRPRVSAIIRHALKEGGSFSYRARFVRPDGEVRTLDTKGEAVLDRNSRPTGIQGATVDVTDFVAAELKGRQQAQGLYAAFEAALDPILVVDDRRRYVHVNRAASELLGYRRRDMLGMSLEELVPRANREDAVAVWEAFLKKGRLRGEIELLCSDGSIALAEYSATANFVPDRHLAVLRDVTERRREESEAQEARRRLEETQVLAEVGSWEWDLGDELTLVSEHLMELLGRDPAGRMSYADFLERLHPDDRESFFSIVETAVQDAGEFTQIFRLVDDDGEVRVIESHGKVEVGEDGKPTRMYGAAQDITERRQAETDLQQQGRLAHEARLETIHRLARAVEMRDIETGGHIERIGIFSAAIAERLGMDSDRIELLRIASPMHDVGKIGIADAILLKPGKLTPEQNAEMQRHAQIGHDLLAESGSDMLELAATIALTHHEWVDGSGYPRGLKGEEIPIEGRIVAVADVFDALTSDRVYRPAFTVDQATKMMRAEAGTHFDAAVLDALLGDLDAILQLHNGLETDPS